jgi:hypothetical protein
MIVSNFCVQDRSRSNACSILNRVSLIRPKPRTIADPKTWAVLGIVPSSSKPSPTPITSAIANSKNGSPIDN